jgi:hypothetical protein
MVEARISTRAGAWLRSEVFRRALFVLWCSSDSRLGRLMCRPRARVVPVWMVVCCLLLLGGVPRISWTCACNVPAWRWSLRVGGTVVIHESSWCSVWRYLLVSSGVRRCGMLVVLLLSSPVGPNKRCCLLR